MRASTRSFVYKPEWALLVLVLSLGSIMGGVLIARADGPLFIRQEISYPNHVARPSSKQTALKDGDQTYLVVTIDNPAVTNSVVADLSALGGGSAVSLTDVNDYVDTNTSPNLLRQFQSDVFVVVSSSTTATVSIPLTATDVNGLVSTASIPVVLDNTVPVATLSSITAATSTPLVQFDVLSLTGNMDGTGSGVRLYQILEQEIASDGVTVLYQSVYSNTHPASPGLYALSGGAFTDVALSLYTANGAMSFPSDAPFLRFVLTVGDDADNYAYATTSIITIASPPVPVVPEPEATTTPSVATTTPEVATSTPEVSTTTEQVSSVSAGGRRPSSSKIPSIAVVETIPVSPPAPLSIPVPTQTQIQTVRTVAEEPLVSFDVPSQITVPEGVPKLAVVEAAPVALSETRPEAPVPTQTASVYSVVSPDSFPWPVAEPIFFALAGVGALLSGVYVFRSSKIS